MAPVSDLGPHSATTERAIIVPHVSYLKVIKVNDPRSGVKDGRPWTINEAECLLLDENGGALSVGVLRIPKDLVGKVVAGDYAASFVLGVDRERKVTAFVEHLAPIKIVDGKVTALPPFKAA